jgi:hypothetical protein
MTIHEVLNSVEEKLWLKLPWFIYKDDKNWIPHITKDVASIFDSEKNKLFRDGAARRWLLKDKSGQVIGRIAAFHSKKYSGAQKQPTGGLGFFECIDNAGAAKKLLDVAVEWLKSQGMEAADGPINFGEKEAYWGLLVHNFTDMSSFRMNYNPPYYKKFFEDYGFQMYYKQLCYKRDLYVPAQEVFVRKTNMLLSEPGYKITNTRGKSLEQIAQDFLTVYNSAWATHPGFKKMQIQQARNAVKAMKQVMDRDIMVFVFHHEKPIGFYINLPEVNEFMQHVNGNLNWWGILKFLYYKNFGKRNCMVGIVFGVDKEYHQKGVEGAMIKWTEENIVPLNRYKDTILTWIGDFNPKMVHVSENLGASLYRTLHTYRKLFDENQPFERHPMIG